MLDNNIQFFHCFTKDVCLGKEGHFYPHLPEKREGGVAIIRDEKLFCLNCKYENSSYRQPENEFYCGENKNNNTYIDVPDYNKLEKCFIRCKTCEQGGNSYTMSCTSCRDFKYYDLIRYNKKEGQCYRKQHKCGIYPYYHNYEIAIDEDDCGEDCDICLYNFKCPKEFPFFKYETHECIKFCSVFDILARICNISDNLVAINLLKNPFGLRNPFDFINTDVNIEYIINGVFFQLFCPFACCLVFDIQEYFLKNGIGKGKIQNLALNSYYKGKNFSIELTSIELEKEKLSKYLKGENSRNIIVDEEEGNLPSTGIDLTECEDILKKRYNLSSEEDLIIIKLDIIKEEIINETEFIKLETNYQMLSYSLGVLLPLQACKDSKVEVTVYYLLKDQHIFTLHSKIESVISNGYNVFDINSPFYHDICSFFTNENGDDVLLDDRRKYYYDENINLCEKNCVFLEFNINAKTYSCKCNFKSFPGEEIEIYNGEIITKKMPDDFRDFISKRSNINVFKCVSEVFSSKGQKNNFGSYLLLVNLTVFTCIIIYHFIIERSKYMYIIYENFTIIGCPPKNNKIEDEKEKKNKEDPKIESEDKEKENYDDLIIYKNKYNSMAKSVNTEIDLVYNDYQINLVPYEIATLKEIRSFMKIYWSFLKYKQSILFTIITNNDNILRSIKIILFILFFSFYMAFTALFFTDNIIRDLYLSKGKINFDKHIINIILSSICSFIAGIIVRFVFIGERGVREILREKYFVDKKASAEKAKKIATIKLYILFALSGLIIILCWYYVSAFCAIFKNSQKIYFINFSLCFFICNLLPVLTCFIPTIMRKIALMKYNKTLYKASQIVSIF